MTSPRRQTYYRRRRGHRPEELDRLFHQITKRFVSWGWDGFSLSKTPGLWIEPQKDLSDLEGGRFASASAS